MWTRVAVPMLLPVGASLAVAALVQASHLVEHYVADTMATRAPGDWLPPVVPGMLWLVVLGVILGVRLSAVRGGTRRECILVALSPVIVITILAILLLAPSSGAWGLALALGSPRGVKGGPITLGQTVMARSILQMWVEVTAASVAAAWLYFFLSRQECRRPGAVARPL